MQDLTRVAWLLGGMLLGIAGTLFYVGGGPAASAAPRTANNDRIGDFAICTGAVSVTPKAPTDGVWLLDYTSGRLLGTVIDRGLGKIVGWAEVNLADEYGVKMNEPVHFLMTTGNIATGQAALYVAETSTGKLGVYTMGPRNDSRGGIVIRRHDLVLFRQPPPGN
jgi:hypothetical protein